MSNYLLTWNPKHFRTDGDDSQFGILNYKVGEVVRWSCRSQQPKLGETVYLIRVGVEPRGIVAKGTISKESYLAEHWSDFSKQNRYIEFKLESLRSDCDQGLLPMMLLQGAMPDQTWSPQTSGIEIKPEYQNDLTQLWEKGSDKHSVKQFFEWMAKEIQDDEWQDEYIKTCGLASEIKQSKKITKDDIRKLWFDSSNGIAKISNALIPMTNRQSSLSYEFLLEKTKEIAQSPTKNTYKAILDSWKVLGGFDRDYKCVIQRVFSAFSPNDYTCVPYDEYLKQSFNTLKEQYQIDLNYKNKDWFENNKNIISEIDKHIETDIYTRNRLCWCLTQTKNVENKTEPTKKDALATPNCKDIKMPLNQILYGPPGTGKTYHTIEAAVKAAEPNFTWETREQLKAEYARLMNEKRIRFVTFHQSYGYEEFVEGLKANSKEGEISYDVEAGIFRQICEQADEYIEDRPATEIHNFTSCWQIFVEKLAEKEALKIPMSQTSFNIFDFNENRIFFEKGNGKKDHTLSINTLKAIFDGSREYPSGLGVYYNPLVRYLKDLGGVETQPSKQRQNYVLIIDEINRGNISKIFGELITLIEPSKRKGEDEALELTLPYSGESFSVPNNLHIIGTMNTADRSLAMMDTALRRRFDFVEMMPNPELLGTIKVDDKTELNLKLLLETLNKRIEILYDREHTLGHAFFIEVKTFEDLKIVFKNKVIPLLEEYFFEDWGKIRLVLGDNRKEQKLPFITEEVQTSQQLKNLFGSNHKLDEYGQSVVNYRLADDTSDVWSNPESYIAIYTPKSDKLDADPEKSMAEVSVDGQ